MSKAASERIGDIVTFKRGYDLPASERLKGKYPVISSGGISGYHSEFKKEGEGIITGRYGTLGEVYYINGKYWPHNTTLYSTNFHGNIPKYVYYLMKCLGNLKTTDKSTVPGINRNDLHELIIPYIESKPNQQKIASVLSALDDKIELNNKINAELEQMAKTIYDYWFVQFDFPAEATAKVGGKSIAGKPYKSSGGKMVWNKEVKREVPEGWEVKSLADFIATDKNGDWGKEEPEGNYTTKVECIRGTDVNGIAGRGDVKTPVRYILEKNEGKILSAGDLVIEISGGSPVQSTGRLAYITQEVLDRFENPLICSNFCKAVSLKEENQLFYFIYTWNKAYDNGIFFGYEGKTSGIKNLLFDTLVSNYKIVEPTKPLLDCFQEKVALFEKQRQKNLLQNQQLSQLRNWLLPMLMNGQVTVGRAYERVEEVLSVAAEDGVAYSQTKKKQ